MTLTGEAQDGFLRVVYDGQEGWANAAYLEVADTSSGAVVQQAQAAEAPAQAENTALAPAPNPDSAGRSGGGGDEQRELAGSAECDRADPERSAGGQPGDPTGSQANGYLNVRTAGQAGWIDSRYLQQ